MEQLGSKWNHFPYQNSCWKYPIVILTTLKDIKTVAFHRQISTFHHIQAIGQDKRRSHIAAPAQLFLRPWVEADGMDSKHHSPPQDAIIAGTQRWKSAWSLNDLMRLSSLGMNCSNTSMLLSTCSFGKILLREALSNGRWRKVRGWNAAVIVR